jgi:hypothetical protein
MGVVNVKTPEDPVPDRSKKWSRDEVASLVTSEIVSLSEEHLVALSPFVVALEPFAEGQSCWLIARDGDRVLYWDGVEKQFATASLTGRTLRDRTLCGEKLEGCLQHFIGAQRPGQ